MSRLTDTLFNKAFKETNAFKSYPKFKQKISGSKQNTDRLFVYYEQAVRYGIEYLKQNPNLFASDVKVIEEVIINNTEVTLNENNS